MLDGDRDPVHLIHPHGQRGLGKGATIESSLEDTTPEARLVAVMPDAAGHQVVATTLGNAAWVVTTLDEGLMARMREQDGEALAILYDRHHRAAYSLALRILQDAGQAEDVVQEAFLAVWRQAPGYDPSRGPVRPWLLTIVHHRAINHLRKQAAPGQLTERDEELLEARQPEVWQAAYQTIRHQEIRAALDELPTDQRAVIDLAFFGGLTHREIAERLNLPLGTVKSRMRLAFRKLETWLERYAADGAMIH